MSEHTSELPKVQQSRICGAESAGCFTFLEGEQQSMPGRQVRKSLMEIGKKKDLIDSLKGRSTSYREARDPCKIVAA